MENRLTECNTSVLLVNYSYDGLGRKTKSKEINHATGETNETKFIYDNWNVIQEIPTSQLHSLTSSYFWGNDLSGSLHGAGGIGGLIANSPFSKGGGGGFYFYNYDANGNVINLIDSEGETAAHYEYSPFGKTISKIGYYAETNKFRFSTKRFEEVGELYYYGFRYYKPKTGNWLTRDPIAENGGVNLYEFVYNNPNYYVDPFGLSWYNPTTWPRYGNWGGKGWSGGKSGKEKPVDSSDRCYRSHDKCWDSCDKKLKNCLNKGKKKCPKDKKKHNKECKKKHKKRKNMCDDRIVKCLKKLNKDPKKWPFPPSPGDEGKANRFRKRAIWWFD